MQKCMIMVVSCAREGEGGGGGAVGGGAAGRGSEAPRTMPSMRVQLPDERDVREHCRGAGGEWRAAGPLGGAGACAAHCGAWP